MYDVIATLPTQCGSHACMVVLHAYARRHCMSTARVSAIPTPRSVTCRGRFIVPGVTNPLGYRTHVGRSAEVASARQGRRPPAAHIQPHAPSQSARCVIIMIIKKKVTVALGMGAPGNWHSHYFSRGGTQSWAKLHRPLRALAQSPLRPRQTTCPRSDGARRPPTLKFGVTVVRRGRGPRILKFRCVRPIARSPRSDRANDDGNDDGNTRSLTSQITSANLEIEIHKPRRACRQTLPAEFKNLALHLTEP